MRSVKLTSPELIKYEEPRDEAPQGETVSILCSPENKRKQLKDSN